MTKKIIALVGRPNVGKSTLFNRLSIRKKAIVHDLPGVTRDRKYTDGRIGSFEFVLMDTPGLEENPDIFGKRLMEQTTKAINEADLICFMVDGRSGILPDDKLLSDFVRKYNKPVILVINKCDKTFDFDKEYYKLGFDSMVAI